MPCNGNPIREAYEECRWQMAHSTSAISDQRFPFTAHALAATVAVHRQPAAAVCGPRLPKLSVPARLSISKSLANYWLDQRPSAAAIDCIHQGVKVGNRPALLLIDEGELPIPVDGLDIGPSAAAICAAIHLAA